jgi:Rrf2 family iron-sulfur cluster assembly transcriptional regulator
MLDLAFHSQNNSVTLTDIATRQIISLSYLEQLFSHLRKAGIVIGVRGPGGGYQLSRAPNQINIADIINAVNEPLDSTKCGGKNNCHNNRPCLTHELWMGLSTHIRTYLENISLADILANHSVSEIAKTQKIMIQFDLQRPTANKLSN